MSRKTCISKWCCMNVIDRVVAGKAAADKMKSTMMPGVNMNVPVNG